ncbi:MAG: hypothetical protein KKB50_07560 [Planctomycetes bacterium]|nr:hypothetical protein [Planctomycetota bacterium]
MPSTTRLRCVVVFLVAGGLSAAAAAGDKEILADIKAFFETADVDRRVELAQRIAGDPDFERGKVAKYLHRAKLFEPLESGRREITVALAGGGPRRVLVRIPHDYTPAKKYPLVYALHGSGSNADNVINYVEQLLGSQVNQFIIAAPDRYQGLVIHSAGKPVGEHTTILLALRKLVRVDSDRVYVMGYSMGGHTTWTLVVLYADQFAGAMPVAGSFALPGLDQLWVSFWPNIANTHILQVWGAQDTAGADGKESLHGGIAGMNRMVQAAAEKLTLPIISYEFADLGHGGVVPPQELRNAFFRRRRVQYPPQVEHTFRFLHQARAYWLEGHTWVGDQWSSGRLGNIDARPDEEPEEALRRAIRARLGQLRGTIDGQTVDVRRKHIGELTIWFGDGMIDWEQPVTVKVSARKVFEGKLDPDLYVCLSQAARTYDLDRLRWAGLRFKSGSKARIVTAETAFPPVIEWE